MSPLPNNQQNDAHAVAERRARVSRLYLQGLVQVEIARQLGVSQTTICFDLQAVRAEWSQSALMDFNDRKAQEIAKLDYLENMAIGEWLRSCQPAETVKEKKDKELRGGTTASNQRGNNRSSNRVNTTLGRLVPVREIREVTTKSQHGDPALMNAIVNIVKMRCQILGILDGDVNVNLMKLDWDSIYEHQGMLDPVAKAIEQLPLPSPSASPKPDNNRNGSSQS